jgi:hypothetical protein
MCLPEAAVLKLARTALGAALLTTLAGCSTTGTQVYHCCLGQSLDGDENKVAVFNVWSAGGAYPLAMTHCQKFGRIAQFERMTLITAHFLCVPAAVPAK